MDCKLGACVVCVCVRACGVVCVVCVCGGGGGRNQTPLLVLLLLLLLLLKVAAAAAKLLLVSRADGDDPQHYPEPNLSGRHNEPLCE